MIYFGLSAIRACVWVGAVAIGAGIADPAAAHLVATGFGPFYDGMLHPLVSIPDMLAVVGLGLLAGRSGAPTARAIVLALPAAWLAAGISASMLDLGELHALAPTLVLIALGGLVAAGRTASPTLGLGAGLLVGGVFGAASGAGLRAAEGAAANLAGTALALFVLAALGAAAVVPIRSGWGNVAIRVAGSWIAAIGFLLLGAIARDGGVFMF